MKNLMLKTLSAAVLTATLASSVSAQITASAIRGKVLDESGNAVANAVVTVTDTRTGAKRELNSNGSGSFLASNLDVGGPYIVSVAGGKPVKVNSLSLGDIFSLTLETTPAQQVEEIVVTAQAGSFFDVATGPAATFGTFELDTMPSFDRDLQDVIALDPRINIDSSGGGVNCAGRHPRFNSTTLDGVSVNDRFGLNSNGYATANGMPFPYVAMSQVSVEMAPFDVTYGGFSACNINAVTKSGSNEWDGTLHYEWTSDSLRGDSLSTDSRDIQFDSAAYTEKNYGFSVGGPIIPDKLFFYVAYEEQDSPNFIAQGYNGSGNGEQRNWLSEADFNRISNIAQTVYNYNTGGLPGDGSETQEKSIIRLDYNINDQHSASLIHNEFEGSQTRASDSDSNEFEYANHFYTKGSKNTSSTLMFSSQWTDALSTEFFYNQSEMDDSQVTVGPNDFAEVQITVRDADGGRNTVYLGADDSRQANALATESKLYKFTATYLLGDIVFTGGFEREELDIFNKFVQHARGGEVRFDSIDDFEAGTFARYYYGNAGGTNNQDDAAASFTNIQNSIYLQGAWSGDKLTVTGGMRYDRYETDDSPVRNLSFEDANNGLRNDYNIDGVDLISPRLGVTYDFSEQTTFRGGIGLFAGGNPNVWLSNAFSNDGITNVQRRINGDGTQTILQNSPNSIALSGEGRPGLDEPQELLDVVLAVNPAEGQGSTEGIVLLDPNYKQPAEWKFALGVTHAFESGWNLELDFLHSRLENPAYYVDISQEVVGETTLGTPIYDFTRGEDNYMLTNSNESPESSSFTLMFNRNYDNGFDFNAGYTFTRAEDLSPMTSSTAGSNFGNLATLDVNNPTAGTSNYETPHRFVVRASYGKDFIGDLETRFTATWIRKSGQAQSYVMGSSDLEGDGFFGRHLLYVPTGLNDPNVVFADGFDSEAFLAWAQNEGLRAGQFTQRNGNNARWSSLMNVRVDQELPTFFDGTSGRIYLKIYNFMNLLNDEWGHQYDAEFFSQQVVESSVDDQGRLVYESFSPRSVTDLQDQDSRWEARLGIQFEF